MQEHQFTWGIEALDTVLKPAIAPRSTILIAGNPGTGKTTLAATICYSNAVRGKPCLYITFHEEKERFIDQMKRFDMDFEELEMKNMFVYLRLPLVTTEDALSDMLTRITSSVERHGVRVVVVDSYTPLGKATLNDIKARTLLQNFFYNLAKTINGIVVLIAEVPIGQETIALGDIEFVTDTVILLKHRVVRGLIERTLEIRKARGAKITQAELPFSIVDKRGIVVIAPPLIERLKPPRIDIRVLLPCKSLMETIDHLHPGHYLYIVVPPDARGYNYVLKLISATILLNRLRTLIISYYWSPEEFTELLNEILEELGGYGACVKRGVDAEALRNTFRELVEVYSLNPASMSLEELYSHELAKIESYRPQLVVFDRTDVLSSIHGAVDMAKHFMYLRNQLLYLRHRDVLTVRIAALVDEGMYRRESSIADAVIRLEYREQGAIIKPYLYVWRSGRDPKILDPDLIHMCVAEMDRLICGEESGYTKRA
ncbi:MAG TPA: hypothetical protein EYH02_03670 [Ignisphaera aggregans]|uniref:KaiC domain-containing protein n=1 Tax=Ignisphaera aggregans TaxID=334771 RepID=A0A832YZT3_9CREN|nr:hypothetical protein [Ignisphaera aggregans]